MIESVEIVAFGRPATDALAAVIERAKKARVLAPVTVVVASNFAGLAVRRVLAGLPGARGLVNVNFVTPLRLAELLAADLLVDRRPLTDPVLASAVRRALATDRRPFGEAAEHVATETAVASLYGELSRLTPAARHAVAADPWGTTVVALYARVDRLIAGFDDEDAVVRAVLARPDLAAALEPFGTVVWYLPEWLSAAQSELLATVVSTAPSSVVVGLTGAGDADHRVLDLCRRAGVDVNADERAITSAASTTPTPATADAIVSVSDADEEVRAVVGAIISLAADGVRFDRIGIFYPQPRPYVRIIEQQLAAAGLPANGPNIDRLAESVAGRTLLAALTLPDERWRRDRVMALLAGAPLRYSGGRARPGAWERVSRHAGIVSDLADWHHKLDAIVAIAADDAAAAGGSRRRFERDREAALTLRAFIDELAALVDSVCSARTWSRKVDAARSLLDELLGRHQAHQRWPDRERDDLDRVVDALSRLEALDALEPSPTHETFTRALHAELDVTRGRTNPYGTGILYAPLAASAGHDLDAVFVVGLAEGLCPMGRSDEALLPERVRLLAGGELDTPDAGMAAQHRALLAAIASAPHGRRTLTYPRGDLRSNHRTLPSRWLLDTASVLSGHRVHSTDFPDLAPPVVNIVPSFAASLNSGPEAPSIDERDLAVVARHLAAGGDAVEHPAVAPVAQAVAMQRARRSSAFTAFDGNLAGEPVPSPVDGTILSATRLERWAGCGFRYFLHDVLDVRGRDDPERIVGVQAHDRGTVMHSVLERFIGQAIADGVPAPDEPWSQQSRDRLHEIADECFDELAARGRTGRALRWRLERSLLHDILDEFISTDERHRRELRARPVRVELAFGVGESVAVELPLADGRAVRFAGKADRVDVDDHGRLHVIDYKTGAGKKYAELADGDPVQGGTTLQLGLYAEAGRQGLGATDAAGYYWMLEADRPDRRFAGYGWTDERRERLLDVVHTIVTGIEQGVFVQVPADWNIYFRTYDNCRHCEFDQLCPAARGEHADAKAGDPALAVRAALADPDAEAGADAAEDVAL